MIDNLEGLLPDAEHISVDQLHELQYWEEALDCDELTLRRALAAVGDTEEEVRQFIAARRVFRGRRFPNPDLSPHA